MADSTQTSIAPKVRSGVAVAAPPLERLEWSLLFMLIIGTPLLYFPMVLHNLPVASHVDERNALEVLRRFHNGSLNPNFFEYPTLYFYLVYMLLLPLPYSSVNAMVVGRLFDFGLIGVIAYLTYLFCRNRLGSRAGGLIGAFLVLNSSVLSDVAGYLHPDILMTVAGTASLYYFSDYFERRSLRSWLLGFLLMGIAIGCKYTACILYAAYFLTEAIYSFSDRKMDPLDRGAGPRLLRRTCISLFLMGSVILISSAIFFPTQHLLGLVANSRSGFEVRPSTYYLDFFHHVRHALVILGSLCSVIAALCQLSRDFYEAISIKRLYWGLGIVLLVSLICTPFSIVHPQQFLFDLGKLVRSNIVVMHGHAQWSTYGSWLALREGALAVLIGTVGIVMLTLKANRRIAIVAVYLAMYLYVLGSSQLGFFRYLAPIIPLLYCGAGFLIGWLWSYKPRTPILAWHLGRISAIMLLGAATVQMALKVAQARRFAETTNSAFVSYVAAKEITKGTVYYSGYAPSIELEEAGIMTQHLRWASVVDGPLGNILGCGDTLILNTPETATERLDAARDKSVTVLVDASEGGQDEQQVVRKNGCK